MAAKGMDLTDLADKIKDLGFRIYHPDMRACLGKVSFDAQGLIIAGSGAYSSNEQTFAAVELKTHGVP